MLTVSDIIHLIQYYYYTQTYEEAAVDVEHFRLEMLRGELARPLLPPLPSPFLPISPLGLLRSCLALSNKARS